MLGYCRDNECGLDLWNPGEHQAVLNRAFSSYARHEQNKEDLIKITVEAAKLGRDMNITVDLDDSFSNEDFEYIKKEVYRRLGWEYK